MPCIQPVKSADKKIESIGETPFVKYKIKLVIQPVAKIVPASSSSFFANTSAFTELALKTIYYKFILYK